MLNYNGNYEEIRIREEEAKCCGTGLVNQNEYSGTGQLEAGQRFQTRVGTNCEPAPEVMIDTYSYNLLREENEKLKQALINIALKL